MLVDKGRPPPTVFWLPNDGCSRAVHSFAMRRVNFLKDAHTQGRDVTINSKGQVHNQHFDTTEYGTVGMI